jgi:hypothetical protein
LAFEGEQPGECNQSLVVLVDGEDVCATSRFVHRRVGSRLSFSFAVRL